MKNELEEEWEKFSCSVIISSESINTYTQLTFTGSKPTTKAPDKRSETCSKLIKIPDINDVALVFLFLTLNIFQTIF